MRNRRGWFDNFLDSLHQTGKPVMFRSIPKQTRKRKQDDNVAQGQVEDEYAYFFQ